MSGPGIDYYYAPVSGFAYLGEPRLMRIARDAGAHVNFRPVDIGKVFASAGTTPPPKQSPARLAYRFLDLKREADRYGMAMNPKPKFWPAPTELAGRLILAAEAAGHDPHLISFAILKAVYAEERNVADPHMLTEMLTEAGFDAAELLERAHGEEAGAAFEAATQEAIAAGVFGSPTYILDGEMFYGQDRLDALAWRLGVA